MSSLTLAFSSGVIYACRSESSTTVHGHPPSGHHEVHEEPPYAAVAVHVRMNVDEYEMPEHHAHRRMLFVDEQLEQRSIASLTASRLRGTCIDFRI
jgi:hypothetical protein